MKEFRWIALLVSICVLLSACVSQPTVSSQTRPGADMRAYKSYGFVPNLGNDSLGYSTITFSYMKSAVQQEMLARGFVYAENNPDLLVNFGSGVQRRTELRSSPSVSFGLFGQSGNFGSGLSLGVPINGGVNSNDYKVGTISIDVVDAKRNEAMWRGSFEGVLTDKALADPGTAVQSAIHQIFMKFPVQQ